MGSTLDQLIDNAYYLNDESPSSHKYDYAASRIWGNSLYKEICRDVLCSPTSGTITTVDGTREYDFPAGVGAIDSISYLATGDTVATPLDPTTFSKRQDVEGEPTRYYIKGKKIGLECVPDDAYSLPYTGFAVPTADLTGGQEPTLIDDDFQEVLSTGLVAKWMEVDKGMDSNEFLRWDASYQRAKMKYKMYLQSGVNAGVLPGVG